MESTGVTSEASSKPGRNSGLEPPIVVLYVHQGRDWIRGSERCMLDLAAGLDRTRFLPVLASNSSAVNRAAVALGIAVHPVAGWDGAGERLLPSRQQVREMRFLLDRYDVRLVHANNPLPLKAVLPAARGRRIPVVAHMHLRTNAHERLYTGLHQASVVVGCSESVLAGIRADGLADSRIRVIYNGVDELRLAGGDASALRSSLGIGNGAVVATAVTSLIELKGIDTLIQAIALLAEDALPVHLMLVGGGPNAQEYIELARELGVEKNVHFLGERDDVGAILREATDIVVTASRSEAFPLNVLEAGLSGRPIIASDIPAHGEAIVNGVTGLLLPTDDIDAFAASMRRLAASPEQRDALGGAAERFVRERFLLQHYVAGFQALYAELTAAGRSSYGWTGGWTWPSAYNTWLRTAVARRLGLSAPGSGMKSLDGAPSVKDIA